MTDKQPQEHSSEHWRGLAKEARVMADGLATEENRRQMLQIAENYERLAEQAEHEQDRATGRMSAPSWSES